jgi:putative ABC transport system ATP-binding protein
MSKTIISVRQLTKVYDMGEVKVHALRGINLDIQEGDFTAILGASGSGKSTFMNIVGCLDIPTSGVYLLDGEDIRTMNKDQLARLRNKKIGFVFQTFNLLARTSALENVELPLLYNSSVKAKKRREIAMKALDMVGLVDRASHLPNQLSGGQQQRVAIARALVNDPVIILADEPTGNLDTRTSYEVMDIFQKLSEKGMTITLVTHEHDISQCAKRNVIFRDGHISKDYQVTKVLNALEELEKIPEEIEELLNQS